MNVNEAKRIEKTVEMAVVKAMQSNLKKVVHQAVHTALGSELSETDVQPKSKTKKKPSLKRTASRLVDREVRNGVLSPMPGGRCEAAKNWSETMEMRIVVTDQGRVWVKKERHEVGVINLKPAGGKWERHNVSFSKRITVEQWLKQVGAVPAEFKGGPRGVV